MLENESTAKCYCIISNGSQSSILVREVGDLYECPYVLLPPQRLKFFPDYVPLIRQELRRDTGLNTTVLRHLQDAEDVQACLMEVHSGLGSQPDGYQWLDGRDGIEWVDEQSADIWKTWKSRPQDLCDASTVAPWERFGWFADAQNWISTRLREAGYELTLPVDQLKGAWGWSSILKAETSKGAVYFKADYERPPKEVAVILKLAERWPQNVPRVMASDMERSWMLMSDFSGESLETLDAGHHAAALSLYAEIQQLTVSDIAAWNLLGCPDMTPGNLLHLTKRLIADTAILCGGGSGLTCEELAKLERKLPQIERLLFQLSSSALPDTLSNEDFRAGNIVLSGGEYVFYDWGSTVISHPMFGINYFLNRMPRSASEDGFRWRNDLQDEKRHELMLAFLSEWADYASSDQLMSEFWLCRRLYPLYEAVKCYSDLPYVGTTSPWGAGTLGYIPQAVRKLLAALDYHPGPAVTAIDERGRKRV